MTTRIDELNTRYLIPGVDIGPAAVADADRGEEDFGDAPYSQMPPMGEIPSPTGWQDLLGLNQVPPDPSRIDPPPQPSSFKRWPTTNAIGGPLRLMESVSSDGAGTPSVSPKVQRMIGMLASYRQAARYIRARASE